ncbi:hypothetical protein NECAME_11880, partial [Necator americanus]
EMYETYIKYSMNPFYTINSAIRSSAFEQKAALYGRKYLTIYRWTFFPTPMSIGISKGTGSKHQQKTDLQPTDCHLLYFACKSRGSEKVAGRDHAKKHHVGIHMCQMVLEFAPPCMNEED